MTSKSERPEGTATNGRLVGLLAPLALALLALVLFRDHVLRLRTYLGNPDRLNSSLKVLEHYVDTLQAGHVAAWNALEMMGYDTFALVGLYPTPIVNVVHAFGPERFYIAAGFVSIALLICAGISAYFALREFIDGRFAAFCGAAIYEFSALSILKMSQNDLSFAVFIVIPLGLLAIHRLEPCTAIRGYIVLTALIAAMVHFMFLQKVAYAILLFGAYAAYRSWSGRSWVPIASFGAAFAAGLTLSSPRLGALVLALSQYARRIPGRDFSSFREVYEFQNVRWYEILRWFEGTIYGESQSEASSVHNNINLSEGFLLYAGCAATLVAIAVIARYRGRWLGLLRGGTGDIRFFIAVLAFAIAVVEFKPVLRLVWELFLRMDFTHARILMAALLPFALLIGLAVERMRPPLAHGRWDAREALILASAMIGALLLARGLFLLSNHWTGFTRALIEPDIKLLKSAIAHFVLTVATLAVLWALSRRSAPGGTPHKLFAYLLIGVVLAQALFYADHDINGSATRNVAVPFFGGDFYSARTDEFVPPSAAQRRVLQERLQNDRYRSVVVCDPRSAGGLCAAHVASFWHIRLADGYYGIGVPARLAAFRWPGSISLRSIHFTDPADIPWKLLGLLNVRQALLVDRAIYVNPSPRDDARDPADVAANARLIANPFPATPRAFFAESIERATSAQEAARKIAEQGAPRERSYVEDFESATGLDTGAEIRLTEGGDWLQADFAASAKRRFIVFNELYYPGWRATAADAPARILATNAVMRGVPVPPGMTRVRLEYVTFSRSGTAVLLYVLGVLVFLAGAWIVRAVGRRERAR